MTDPTPGAPPPSLTPADRARLRPSVDADALERFLAAIPDEDRPGVRRAAVLHFSREVTVADVRDFLLAIGNEEEAAQIDRALATVESESPKPEVHRATEPGQLSYVTVPTTNPFFTMEPPESPHLRALWDAVEPARPASG